MTGALLDLDEARKNRERIAEMRKREAHGEKPLPEPVYSETPPTSVSLLHGNKHSGAFHQGKRHKSIPPKEVMAKPVAELPKLLTPQPQKPALKPKNLEDYEPGVTRDEF